MGTEVTYEGFFCGVHPDRFEQRLEEAEEAIRSIQLEMAMMCAVEVKDIEEHIFKLKELWEAYEEEVVMSALIRQAMASDKVDVSY